MTNEEKYKTPEERTRAYMEFCQKRSYCDCPMVQNADFGRPYNCTFHWLVLEAEDEEPLPCPFCGGKASAIVVPDNIAAVVRCGSCRATSGNYNTKKEAIAEWNRRAK